MHVLELPSELLDQILVQAVIARWEFEEIVGDRLNRRDYSRGVARGLRLKLVCKLFYNCIPRAIFESRVLDGFFIQSRYHRLNFMDRWQIRRHYGADDFWHSYLVYRSKNEKDPKAGRFVEIRHLAEEVCRRHTDAEYEATLDKLCWLALERATIMPGTYDGWKRSGRAEEAPNPGLNLMSAAAYLGYLPIVEELLREGYCPTVENDLFPSPIELAAWAGNADILRRFQTHLPDFERIDQGFGWRGKAGPGAIKGAALRGDVEIARLATQPFLRDDTEGERIRDDTELDRAFEENEEIRETLFYAKNPEMFKYISALVRPRLCLDDDEGSLLKVYVELGNVEMVRYLLDAGAKARNWSFNLNPLQPAARHWHVDIVDLLLERGADPNNMKDQQAGSPLTAAAAGGSMAIVRRLLSAGAIPDSYGEGALKEAVILEHTAMVKLLWDLHPFDKVHSSLLKIANEEGLESMAQLLTELGDQGNSSNN